MENSEIKKTGWNWNGCLLAVLAAITTENWLKLKQLLNHLLLKLNGLLLAVLTDQKTIFGVLASELLAIPNTS
jgi:hypothetical protein